MEYQRQLDSYDAATFVFLDNHGLKVNEAMLWFSNPQLSNFAVLVALGSLCRATAAALKKPPDLLAAQAELNAMADFCMTYPVEQSPDNPTPTLN